MKEHPIRLRAVEPEDVDMMYECENDKSAWYTSDTTAPLSYHLLKRYAETYMADPWGEGQLRLIAENAKTGEIVGIADFFELSQQHCRGYAGIYIRPQFRKKGIGKSVLETMIDYAFVNLQLHHLAAHISTENIEGIRLFESCGFKKAGVLKDWHRSGGNFIDISVYQMISHLKYV